MVCPSVTVSLISRSLSAPRTLKPPLSQVVLQVETTKQTHKTITKHNQQTTVTTRNSIHHKQQEVVRQAAPLPRTKRRPRRPGRVWGRRGFSRVGPSLRAKVGHTMLQSLVSSSAAALHTEAPSAPTPPDRSGRRPGPRSSPAVISVSASR